MTPHVVIEISNGCLTLVTSNTSEIIVTVIDHDGQVTEKIPPQRTLPDAELGKYIADTGYSD